MLSNSAKSKSGLTFIILSISLLFLVQVAARTVDRSASRGDAVLTGQENHSISLAEAERLISNHRQTLLPGDVRSEMFGREAIARILDQKDCAGLRIHYARRDDGTPVLVLIGVDRYGVDITSGEIVEHGFLCPPMCDQESGEAL